jgi:hypothetical protein
MLAVKDSVEKLHINESGRDQTDMISYKIMLTKGAAQIASLERKKIVDWISKDKARETFKGKLEKRQPGTGHWFLEDPAFQEWVTGGGKTLWCPGIRTFVLH